MHNVILSDTPTLNTSQKAILISSHHYRSKPRPKREYKPRTEAQYNTKSYNDGLQRAFNKAKLQIYFNPDMKYFVTLTYRGTNHTPEKVLNDVKVLIKRESRQSRSPDGQSGAKTAKYIYIMEYQKRGSIHVHMITNDFLSLQVNANGYRSLKFWPHGFTSVLTINDFDENFRPYLYLFKYMRKAQRIGKSFIHASRNLNNFYEVKGENLDVNDWDTKTQERTEAHILDLHLFVYKYYLKRVIVSSQLNMEAKNGRHRPEPN